MHRSRPWFIRLVAVCLLLALAGSAALCQGPPPPFGAEAFGIPSRFGSAAPTSTRQLALGAVVGCVDDVQFANPAFAAVRTVTDASVRLNRTDFDAGPRITSVHLHLARPLRVGRSGFQVSWLDLNSSDGDMILPGPTPIPVKVDMSENVLVVDYGRRVGAKSTAGLSVLGFQNVDFSMTPPVGPALIALDAKADYGGRLGAAYEYQPGDYLGILYNFAQHTVDANGLFLGGVPSSPVYHDDLLIVGMSYHHPCDRFMAVGEFHHGGIKRGDFLAVTNAWHVGAEYLVTPGLAVRVGKSDGSLTYGAGYAARRWHLDYAHIQNWNGGAVGQLFGGSDTDSLQATLEW